MPNVRKSAAKRFRSPVLGSNERPVTSEALQVLKRAAESSKYWRLFGTRGVGQPPNAVPLWSRGNAADKVLAERRALAVLRYEHREELLSLYAAELDYIEAGGE